MVDPCCQPWLSFFLFFGPMFRFAFLCLTRCVGKKCRPLVQFASFFCFRFRRYDLLRSIRVLRRRRSLFVSLFLVSTPATVTSGNQTSSASPSINSLSLSSSHQLAIELSPFVSFSFFGDPPTSILCSSAREFVEKSFEPATTVTKKLMLSMTG